jgi:dihydroorotate dehydrogenase electron transfer subunit
MPIDTDASVISNTVLSADYSVLALAAPEIAEQAAPGQFVMLKMGGRSDPLLRRPFSLFEVIKEDGRIVGLSILNKRVGTSTGVLFEARPGDRVRCLGPLGKPFAPVSPPMEAWLVAGGVGLAPFATLAEIMRVRGTEVALYYGARSAAGILRLDIFERLGVRLVLATEDGSRGAGGLITVPLERDLRARPKSAPVTLYACGPEAMLAAVARLAAAHGRPAQVSVERVMGCGLGGCYSCVVRLRTGDGASHYVRSCVSGPVFDGDALVWE